LRPADFPRLSFAATATATAPAHLGERWH